ncbi:MAG: UvrD-helicase domain-containing protein, partial [FCB group bacterium]|nr:UvrD-helicase domain-containing protein [FCB group bacterium]
MHHPDRLLEGLNPPQGEAVLQTEGPVLVLAGAGSGKTRVITRRVAYIIGTGRAKPGEIVAVTFTNKAAGEMRERVASLVGPKAATDIVISTFHSFCLRILRTEIERLGYRKDFTISSESETRTRLRRILADLDGIGDTFSPETFIGHIGAMKNTDGPPAAPPKEPNETEEKYAKWLPDIFERYQSALRAANALDFDDLLLLTLKIWRDFPPVLERYRKKFRYVMVDEFQDTNPVQYALLKALAGEHRNLCVVGDDDQSIYGWRGADIRNILEFERDFPGAHIVKLEQNYRSTETILEAANRVISNNANRREKKLWSNLGKGRVIDWLVNGDDEHEAKSAVKWLEMIRERTGANYADFAVLYRSNTQSRPIEIAFRQAGIPYTVYGGQDFFERSEVRDILSYLKALSNPYDEAPILRIINVPRRGIGDVTLHRVHDLCRAESMTFIKGLDAALKRDWLTGEARKGLTEFLALMRDFRRRLKDREGTLRGLVHELIERIDYRGEIGRTSKQPEQMMARWSYVEAVVQAVADYEKNTDKPTLSGFLDNTSLDPSDGQRGKAKRKNEGVSLMTIHSAKGLEFPFVFIMGLEEGLLPHERSVSEGGLDEERRLFYVALTRGQRHVTIFEAISRNKHGKEKMSKTSRFMQEIPTELLRQRPLAVRQTVQEKVTPPPQRPP